MCLSPLFFFETYLSRELAGLKTLLTGLVGGRGLSEWEREWTVRFGGPETDEPERWPASPPAEGREKKRGRPRKVIALSPTALAPALSTSVPMQAAPQDATQRQLSELKKKSADAGSNHKK
ncbi:BHLH domain-containing protein [Mycena sanguinolenta]|uniref:BHLH domain-containing protein n=1 Tax=Mycena sanguinolenta TaxID=230812 RepID=A0A8H7CG32_9AGAR|nr:BHLH domain-containing protein [Mycena sanguinolenta]